MEEQMFTCFPDFPTEIRLEIWGLVASIERRIDIRVEEYGQVKHRQLTLKCFRYRTHTFTPPILHTSHEAREAGMQFYQLGFGTYHKLDHDIEIKTPARIYVNRDYDIICPIRLVDYSRDVMMDFFHLDRISRIALSVLDFGIGPPPNLLNMWPRELFLYYPRFAMSLLDYEGDSRIALSFTDFDETIHMNSEWSTEIVERAKEVLNIDKDELEKNFDELLAAQKIWVVSKDVAKVAQMVGPFPPGFDLEILTMKRQRPVVKFMALNISFRDVEGH